MVVRGIKVISTCRRGEVGRCVVSGALSIRICWSLLLLGATGASTSSSLGLNWDGLDWEGLDSGLLGLLGLLLERIESRGVLSTICWREAGAGLLFSRPTDSLGVSRFWEGPRGIAFWFRCTFLVKLQESHQHSPFLDLRPVPTLVSVGTCPQRGRWDRCQLPTC